MFIRTGDDIRVGQTPKRSALRVATRCHRRVGRTRTDDRAGLCFSRPQANPTLAPRGKTPPAHSAARNPEANDMRISPLEAAAILSIGIVTMQLHSAERANPRLRSRHFLRRLANE